MSAGCIIVHEQMRTYLKGAKNRCVHSMSVKYGVDICSMSINTSVDANSSYFRGFFSFDQFPCFQVNSLKEMKIIVSRNECKKTGLVYVLEKLLFQR